VTCPDRTAAAAALASRPEGINDQHMSLRVPQ